MKRNRPVRAAFSADDPAFREHALPLVHILHAALTASILADLWYYPNGPVAGCGAASDLDLQAREIGYYHVPTYMADKSGDLVFQVPLRSLIAINSWVHVFMADMVFGLFARGARFEKRLQQDLGFKLGILARLCIRAGRCLNVRDWSRSAATVRSIRGCHPWSHNHRRQCHHQCGRGDRQLHHRQQCQHLAGRATDAVALWATATFLPFRSALFMTTVMENSMIAQNTCMQLCVVGRNTFVGAGSTFTDYNLMSIPLRARDGSGKPGPLQSSGHGGCHRAQLQAWLRTDSVSITNHRIRRCHRRSASDRPRCALRG